MGRALALAFCVVAMAAAGVCAPAAHASPSLRQYTKTLAAKQGWTGKQWDALDWIVSHESSWNPCRYFPSSTDCRYRGSASCGIPQKQPCPQEWRGRLWESRFEQCRKLIVYVKGRYGDPLQAKSHWLSYSWY